MSACWLVCCLLILGPGWSLERAVCGQRAKRTLKMLAVEVRCLLQI